MIKDKIRKYKFRYKSEFAKKLFEEELKFKTPDVTETIEKAEVTKIGEVFYVGSMILRYSVKVIKKYELGIDIDYMH